MKRLLISLLICLSISFIMLQLFELKVYAYGVRALMLVGLTILYIYEIKEKRLFFLMFLLFFTVAEIINFSYSLLTLLTDTKLEAVYYFGNLLCILAYCFLIVQVLRSVSLKQMVHQYPFHIVTLVVLDIFCVWIVSSTTEKEFDFSQFAIEFTYNMVIMVLLSVALLNYIYRDDKKSMNLLLGTIFIVFAEVIQFAYAYVAGFNFLNVLYSIFLICAFLFFYLQATLKHEDFILNYHNSDIQELEA